MVEGKASKKYKKYIDSLEDDIIISFGIAVSFGPEYPSIGRTLSLSKKDIALTQNDEHFIIAKALPAIKEKIVEIIQEYKGDKMESFTSDLLGDKVIKKLSALATEVQKELEEKYKDLAPAPEQDQEPTTAKQAKGFIGK